jgi:hypothetical protein
MRETIYHNRYIVRTFHESRFYVFGRILCLFAKVFNVFEFL